MMIRIAIFSNYLFLFKFDFVLMISEIEWEKMLISIGDFYKCLKKVLKILSGFEPGTVSKYSLKKKVAHLDATGIL
jgi:hypothetical protein